MKNQTNIQEYLYDFSVDGGALSAITLSNKNGKNPMPVGAIVKDVTVRVITPFLTGTGATLSWGYTGAVTAYSGVAKAAGALTQDAIFEDITPVYVADAATGAFVVDIAVGTFTAGKAVFVVEYLYPAINV